MYTNEQIPYRAGEFSTVIRGDYRNIAPSTKKITSLPPKGVIVEENRFRNMNVTYKKYGEGGLPSVIKAETDVKKFLGITRSRPKGLQDVSYRTNRVGITYARISPGVRGITSQQRNNVFKNRDAFGKGAEIQIIQ